MFIIILTVMLLLTGCAYTHTPNNECHILLENSLTTYIDQHSNLTKGISLQVFTANEILIQINYGYANAEKALNINPYTVFEWGSVTKLLVYVSALQLYERGYLDLGRDIFTYINKEYFPNILYPITMRQLMHHRAGFVDPTMCKTFLSL